MPDLPEADNGDATDGTLGGYMEVHGRPPAFEGSDAHPYTVSIEVERTANLRTPFSGFLVFPRWAQTGVGIIGHVETDTLHEAAAEDEVQTRLRALTLHEVQALLEEGIRRRGSDDDHDHIDEHNEDARG